MPAPAGRDCQSCQFWERTEQEAFGVCHRYPQLRRVVGGKLSLEVLPDAPWYSKPTDWCGEWVKK